MIQLMTCCVLYICVHVSERQTRQKELQELEKRLTAAHRDLREEELKMKHKVADTHAHTCLQAHTHTHMHAHYTHTSQVVLLEKELKSHRIEGQELKQKSASLYLRLSRLSGEKVELPKEMSTEEEEGKTEEAEDSTRSR